MEDEKLDEKFRQMTMHLERIESDYQMLNIEIHGLEVQIERVNDELTLPSGRMSQRFSQLEKQIQQLGAKSSS
jgi:predicted  nucleic acid-binding Zn-ribbon protein